MNKKELVHRIIQKLLDDLEQINTAARDAHSVATDEENKAENKYDTLALESSYLAQGQSNRALELNEAIKEYHNLALTKFAPDTPIDLSALVELEDADQSRRLIFLGPACGGLEVTLKKRTITIITPSAPLAEKLTGCKQGDTIKMEFRHFVEKSKIIQVW